MRHLKEGKKLHRKTDARKMLIKHLVSNLIIKGRITTSKAKAQETRRKVEKLVTKAKQQTLSSRRSLQRFLSKKVTAKLYSEIAPIYKDRPGGYVRIIKTAQRKVKDGSELVILEWVDKDKISK